MGLFQTGNFTLHSGGESLFKIDCDALSDDDLEACAQLITERVPSFSQVFGIPRGGVRLHKALDKYIDPTTNRLLIVDDVWTTGTSMRSTYLQFDSKVIEIQGAVIFARNPADEWVTPLFQMS